MTNMPFFTLPIPTVTANNASTNTAANPTSLQKNTQTQALSPANEFDGSAMGGDGGASFAQALDAQLQTPALSVGQEFAALVPTTAALQTQVNQQTEHSDEALVDATWQALQPLMNQPLQSPLELQDIQRQRAQSLKLSAQTKPVDGTHLQGVGLQGEPGPHVQPGQLSMAANGQQNLQTPLPVDGTTQADVASREPGQLMAQTANAVPAFNQKPQGSGGTLRGDGTAVNDSLSDPLGGELHGELETINLHEKPLTLTTKTTLQGETFTPPPQVLVAEAGPAASPDTLMQGSTGFSKELAVGDAVGPKNPLPVDTPLQSQFKLDVPPKHPQWSEQIAKRIGIMSNDNVQTARIQLDPPELGALEVKIKIQNDHMTVAFASGNSQVREALEAQSPRLREMMEQQGMNLADVNVSDQSSQQAGSGQGQEEFGQQGPASGVEGEIENEQSLAVEVQSDSLVDYFA